MKKFLVIILTLMLIVSFVACDLFAGNNNNQNNGNTNIIDNDDKKGGNIVNPNSYQPGIIDTEYATESVLIADYIFVADNTGKTDVTKSLNDLIKTCYDNGGGTIFVPSGHYLISGQIKVLSFVYLVGDYNDPDGENFDGNYGTVFFANVAKATTEERSDILADRDDTYTNFPSLFRIGGSAGLIGVTIYYPNQNENKVEAYPFTIEIPSFAAEGCHINHHASTVKNVTMLNSYKGIIAGASASSEFSGGYGAAFEQVHIENVKGTYLYQGYQLYIASEAGVVRDVTISNDYWKNCSYRKADSTALDTYTKDYTTGMLLGDLEWLFFDNIKISDVCMGIRIFDGIRRFFTNEMYFIGQFYNADIRNTHTALRIDNMFFNFGITIADSYFEGDVYSINERDNTTANVKLVNCTLVGKTYGDSLYVSAYNDQYVSLLNNGGIASLDIPETAYQVLTLIDVVKDYGADNTGANDASAKIQQALDFAHLNGGGIVYLRAGYYIVNNPLTVYDNTELRGAASASTRDQIGLSNGTVLLADYGYTQSDLLAQNNTALVTLMGQNAGMYGIRVCYYKDKPNLSNTNALYKLHSYTIRIMGEGSYVKCCSLVNTCYGIEILNTKNVVVSEVSGCVYKIFVNVLNSQDIYLNELLENGAVLSRLGYSIVPNLQSYFLTGWPTDGSGLSKIYSLITRYNTIFFNVESSTNVSIVNTSAFGIKTFYNGKDSTSKILCCNSDNCSSYIWDVDGGELTVCNMLKYNDTDTFRAQNGGVVNAFNDLTLWFRSNFTLDKDYYGGNGLMSVKLTTSTEDIDDLPKRAN